MATLGSYSFNRRKKRNDISVKKIETVLIINHIKNNKLEAIYKMPYRCAIHDIDTGTLKGTDFHFCKKCYPDYLYN